MLTPAETRVLQQVVHGGATMLEIATTLSITEATAKTTLATFSPRPASAGKANSSRWSGILLRQSAARAHE